MVTGSPAATVDETPKRGVRSRGNLPWIVACVVGVLLICVAVQAYASGSDAEFLARPVNLGDGTSLVAFEQDSQKLVPGERAHATLFFDGERRRETRVWVTPTSLFVVPTHPPSLHRRLLGTHDLDAVDVTFVAPRWLTSGAYSLRIEGYAQTFGEYEVVKKAAGR